nr:unnamed protein product [Spirometra erinaceieuropaei]
MEWSANVRARQCIHLRPPEPKFRWAVAEPVVDSPSSPGDPSPIDIVGQEPGHLRCGPGGVQWSAKVGKMEEAEEEEEEDEEEEEEENVADAVEVCCHSKLTHAQFALPTSPCHGAHGGHRRQRRKNCRINCCCSSGGSRDGDLRCIYHPLSSSPACARCRDRVKKTGDEGDRRWMVRTDPHLGVPPHPLVHTTNDQDFNQQKTGLEAGTAEAAPRHAANAWLGSYTVVRVPYGHIKKEPLQPDSQTTTSQGGGPSYPVSWQPFSAP